MLEGSDPAVPLRSRADSGIPEKVTDLGPAGCPESAYAVFARVNPSGLPTE